MFTSVWASDFNKLASTRMSLYKSKTQYFAWLQPFLRWFLYNGCKPFFDAYHGYMERDFFSGIKEVGFSIRGMSANKNELYAYLRASGFTLPKTNVISIRSSEGSSLCQYITWRNKYKVLHDTLKEKVRRYSGEVELVLGYVFERACNAEYSLKIQVSEVATLNKLKEAGFTITKEVDIRSYKGITAHISWENVN